MSYSFVNPEFIYPITVRISPAMETTHENKREFFSLSTEKNLTPESVLSRFFQDSISILENTFSRARGRYPQMFLR